MGTYNVFMALRLKPLADAELVLDGTQQTRLLLCDITAAVEDSENLVRCVNERIYALVGMLFTFMPRLHDCCGVAKERARGRAVEREASLLSMIMKMRS